MARKTSIVLVALVGIAICAAPALATATPLTPSPGAIVTTAHPVFGWTLPATEDSDAIYIANNPAVTTEGKLFDENLVDLDVLQSDARQWSPSSPLYAGHYWWNVWSNDRNTFASYYSAPAAFTIPVSVRLRSVKTKRYTSFLHYLDVGVRWTANVRRPLVRVRLLHGRKVVWKAGETAFNAIGVTGSSSFTWYRPRRIKQGTRLKLVASISSGGFARTRTVVVRAP